MLRIQINSLLVVSDNNPKLLLARSWTWIVTLRWVASQMCGHRIKIREGATLCNSTISMGWSTSSTKLKVMIPSRHLRAICSLFRACKSYHLKIHSLERPSKVTTSNSCNSKPQQMPSGLLSTIAPCTVTSQAKDTRAFMEGPVARSQKSCN